MGMASPRSFGGIRKKWSSTYMGTQMRFQVPGLAEFLEATVVWAKKDLLPRADLDH